MLHKEYVENKIHDGSFLTYGVWQSLIALQQKFQKVNVPRRWWRVSRQAINQRYSATSELRRE
jgi:hypothetical protein